MRSKCSVYLDVNVKTVRTLDGLKHITCARLDRLLLVDRTVMIIHVLISFSAYDLSYLIHLHGQGLLSIYLVQIISC